MYIRVRPPSTPSFEFLRLLRRWRHNILLLHLQYLTRRTRQQSALGVWVLALKVVADLLHGDPLDALVLVDVLNQPLVHEQDMGAARDVGVDGDGKDELVVLAVEVVEVVPPDVLDVPGIDPSVGVCVVFDKHLP